MVWPTSLTTNADILKYIGEQGLTRILEPGNDYALLHEGVSEEVKNWLECHRINDADLVINSDAFKSAAIHLFAAKVLRPVDKELAEEYNRKYMALIRSTRVDVSEDVRSSGTVGKVVVIRQGTDYYNSGGRSNQLFKHYRS